MDIKIQQFLFGKLHSWSVVGKEIGRSLLNGSQNVDFVSTDGIVEKFIPEDLKRHIKIYPQKEYDCQISYTAPINFEKYLSFGAKNRFGIWCYEWEHLPKSFATYMCSKHIDKFLAPSPWFYHMCIKNGIPKEKLAILPHGIDVNAFENIKPYELKTKKSVKIFINLAQVHLRKNIEGTLAVFGESFTKKDDVCLVIKTTNHKPTMPFELSFDNVFNNFKKKYPNHAECEIIKEYIPSMESLYLAIDILFMLPKSEGFFMPALESLAAKKIIITSNYGGAVNLNDDNDKIKSNLSDDEKKSFLNNDNSFLINGKIVRCPMNYQYWAPNVLNAHFEADVKEAKKTLIYCVKNIENIKKEKKQAIEESGILKQYTWNKQAEKIINMCK